MPELAEILRLYGPDYLEQFSDCMLPSHIRALYDIADCRTEALGGHVFQCDQCGQVHYAYHSCRNRHCPQCHGKDTRRWTEECEKFLLPVPYFHLVFTLPQELRSIVRSHQRVLLDILCQAAARAFMKLASDPHYIGGRPGILMVVHTWTRAMIYHPHVHCLIPGGGLSADGSAWLPCRKSYLVPVTALSLIFRAKFMQLARKALPQVRFPASIWQKQWVVYSKPTVQGADKVLRYLARYVHRVAIANSRILSIDNGQVQFRYKDSRQKAWKTMTLPAQEFIRRFLQHVLPAGFHKVRYYGIFAPCNRDLLKRARQLLADADDNTTAPLPDVGKNPAPPYDPMPCPFCKVGHLTFVATIPRKGRDPP